MSQSSISIEEKLNSFLNTQTWKAAEEMVMFSHDLLLDPRVDGILLNWLQKSVANDDQWTAMNLQTSRNVLGDCRTMGISKAMAPFQKVTFVPYVSQELHEEYRKLSSQEKFIALMISHPELNLYLAEMSGPMLAMRLQSIHFQGDISHQLKLLQDELDKVHPLYTSFAWAQIKNYIGKFLALSEDAGRVQHLQDAIFHWEGAREVLESNTIRDGLLWAEIQVNLAMAYTDFRMPGNRPENFTKAQIFIADALNIYSQKYTPVHWANTQLKLAEIFIEHPVQNVEKAIELSQSTMDIFSRYSDEPEKVGHVKGQIGYYYLLRKHGDPSENIENAILLLDESRKILEGSQDSVMLVKIYRSLGDAFFKRIKGNPMQNQEMAIQYLEKASAE